MKILKIKRTEPHENFVVKFKLYPNRTQEELFRKNTGCRRFVWNRYLAHKQENYLKYKSGDDQTPFSLVGIKDTFDWLKESDATSLQQSIRDADEAFKRFYSSLKGGSKFGLPRFKKKGQDESFRVCMTMDINESESKIRIGKHGWIKARGSWSQTPQEGNIQSITVKRQPDGWYASVLFRIKPRYLKEVFLSPACGVDLGVKIPLAIAVQDFDGSERFLKRGASEVFLKRLEKKESKIKKWQRRLAKKQKGSKNRAKTRTRLQKSYQDLHRFKLNFQEKTSRKLAEEIETVVFEDLKLSNMTRQVKTTEDGSPRKNVSAKSGLNHELLRLGLATIVAKVESKKNRRFGGSVIKVDPRFTSQTCSDCGSVDKESRKSQSRFQCVHCGFKLNADFNAARNILARGLNTSAA